MQDNIPFARPFLGIEEEEALVRVLRSGWLTTGPEALAFEREFAAFLEARDIAGAPLYALAVNSATAGLHLALDAVNLRRGDVALLPSYTFAATAEVVRYFDAEVAFVDAAPSSFLLDIEKLRETIERLARGKSAYPHGGPSGRPRAVIPVHFGGLCCDMEPLMALAAEYDLAVIEDAAHALPSVTAQGRIAGTIGDVGVFSFYATKTLATGEGGMAVTRKRELAERMSVMRLHGIDRPVWNRYQGSNASWYYEIIEAGYKYNMCDILAALGRVQLRRVIDLWQMRTELAARYDAAFRDDERFILPPTAPGDARHLYPLRLTAAQMRDSVIESLKAQGIGVSVHFIPLHTMPYYTKRYPNMNGLFPESARAGQSEISLPLWPGMTEEQIERVITAVRHVC